MKHETDLPIVLAGGGLAGSLLAVLLAQRGFHVELFETRPDLRRAALAGGRSINLALSVRGIRALELAGLQQQLLAEAVPMYARAIHDPRGHVSLQPYGPSRQYFINAISRNGLNRVLLEAAGQLPQLQLHFSHRCTDADPASGTAWFEHDGKTVQAKGQAVLGTDGAGSAVRAAFAHRVPGFAERVEPLGHAYKELIMPPNAQGDYAMEPHALHIWPRGQFMLIALPNLGGSFTCTLFLAEEGPTDAFSALPDAQAVEAFFARHFADALALIPDLTEQFLGNPTGKLATLFCQPWAHERAALLGDAAHAIVPFYGQGMNASFEDVRVLVELLDELGPDWPRVLARFAALRKPNGDAIARLALENFVEMRDHTADPHFQRKRAWELELEARFPGAFQSKYHMVTFTHLPYADALRLGNLQDAYLLQQARQGANPEPEALLQGLGLHLAGH